MTAGSCLFFLSLFACFDTRELISIVARATAQIMSQFSCPCAASF